MKVIACTSNSALYHVFPDNSGSHNPLFSIGSHTIRNPVILAPMAGYSDLPFRELAWQMGAGLVVSEMISARPELWQSDKSRLRNASTKNTGPHVVQIEGSEPHQLAAAAVYHAGRGADIIDINMGCPAKKVCRKAAGSALLRDEVLVGRILAQVVAAVDLPVTLKTRTGWSPECRNGPTIAHIAQESGIQALIVHGRTRACRFNGVAEYDTIARIKQDISIPVIANGDITTPQQAQWVMDTTGADGVMIGRAAWGAPWLLGQIATWLEAGQTLAAPSEDEVVSIMLRHVVRMHEFYGGTRGVRIARKHLKCYLEKMHRSRQLIQEFNALAEPEAQLGFLLGLKSGREDTCYSANRSRAA